MTGASAPQLLKAIRTLIIEWVFRFGTPRPLK